MTPNDPSSNPTESTDAPLSNFDVFLSNETFSSLDSEGRQKITRLLKTLHFRPGEFILRAGEKRDSGLYIVIEGKLQALVQHASGNDQVVGVLGAGNIFGEMELITGQVRQASIQGVTSGELIFLPKNDFDKMILEYPGILNQLGEMIHRRFRRNQLAQILPTFFGPLSVEVIEEIERSVEWVHLQRGDLLMRLGEVDGYFYIVVNGRLEARVPDARGKEQTMTVLQIGDTVGEMQVFTDEPRSANVYAVRESDLVRFSRETFSVLQAKYPEMTLSITRQIIGRMRQLLNRKTARTTLLNIALVPLSAMPMRKFVSGLENAISEIKKVLALSSEKVNEALISPGISQLSPGELNEVRLLTWLDERETAFPYLLYIADAQLTPWTIRCILRADRVIFVGDGHSAPDGEYIQKVVSLLVQEKVETSRELALFYSRETSGVGVASRWLPGLEPVSRHYHVQTQADFRRMARLLTGTATGLVLGGGGARGFAHIGVLQAIRELGIDIDLVGGTSMGAIIGGAYALGKDYETIYKVAKTLSTSRKMVDYTWPITSLAMGKPFTEMLAELFGDTKIEDAWREFFCVSANLTQAQVVIHHRGSLWKYTRASSSCPPLFAPVLENGDLLMDGALFNNLPVDLMREVCETGKIIGVDVSAEEDLKADYNFEPVLSGWQMLFNRFRPFSKRIYAPKLINIAMRAAEINSVRLKRQQYDIADVMIRPDVGGFDLFQIDAIDSLVERGHDAGKPALESWLSTQ